jgi:hypothetical protein
MGASHTASLTFDSSLEIGLLSDNGYLPSRLGSISNYTISFVFVVILSNLSDRQTDRQTDGQTEGKIDGST